MRIAADGKGIIIAGSYGELIAREKQGEQLELGELLVSKDEAGKKLLLQVTDLQYGSQINQQNRELLSGLAIEDHVELSLQDSHLRTYTLATLKPLLVLPAMKAPKSMPSVYSTVHAVSAADVPFEKPEFALSFGNLRSGSKELSVPVAINAKEALSHHILIAATTGRGKSNLMKVLLQDLLDKEFASVLVFDPHAEYADAIVGKRLSVFSKEPSAGEYSLRVHLGILRPNHFDGVLEWSDAQREAMRLYFRTYKGEWISELLKAQEPLRGIHEGTLMVLQRRLSLVLGVEHDDTGLRCHSVFDTHQGSATIEDITRRLVDGGVVVIETASVSDAAEVLLATLITTECYERWKRARPSRILSVCMEEAPRFLGDDVLKRGPNVFSQIAREGRKFGVGLIAITQLPSLIPRQVLANMNTKIILGIEMTQERKAIVDSSPHDLSSDERVIASLEKGEAIVSSVFTPFAIPVRVPLHRRRVAQTSAILGLKA